MKVFEESDSDEEVTHDQKNKLVDKNITTFEILNDIDHDNLPEYNDKIYFPGVWTLQSRKRKSNQDCQIWTLR